MKLEQRVMEVGPAGTSSTARDDDLKSLPVHLRERPSDRLRWEFPTAWLFGTKMLSSLGQILGSSLFKFDPRDWMTAGAPIDLTRETSEGACWIDFMADTGDSQRVVYQLAYLLQQRSLEVDDGRGTTRTLPRGRALVLGGDTAYPVSTRNRLVERIRAPFIWARHELERRDQAAPRQPAVPLLGIPGNHDYYNMLDGFHRQFRGTGPADRCDADPVARDRIADPVLDVPGYTRAQEASYFALMLPFDWQLWGLDIECRGLDDRQRRYFRSLPPSCKRIVVTSRPGFVYSAPSAQADQMAAAFRCVGVEAAFRVDGATTDPSAIQLDLSGDDHIYERYWGTTVAPEATRATGTAERRDVPDPAPRGNETESPDVTPPRENYASVVSGLGGAFHHPSQIRFGDTAPVCAWPGSERSAVAIGERLLRPRKVFQAGAVGIVGSLVALLCLGLVWLAKTGCSVMDFPFERELARHSPLAAFGHLGVVALVAGSIVAVGGLFYVCRRWANKLAEPIRTGARGSWWSRWTHAISHGGLMFWLLRWAGGGRRNAWTFLVTLPALLPAIAAPVAIVWMLARCPQLTVGNDHYVPLYTAIVVIVLIMIALACVSAGRRFRHPDVSKPRAAVAHVILAVFGALIGVLIVWTPYAWMRLVVQDHAGASAVALLAVYPVVRKLLFRTRFLCSPTLVRRGLAVLAFVAVVAWAILVPIGFTTPGPLASPPAWAIVPMAFFGAYFSCLWLGWYFFLCLQWNAHGNEAGGAARVTSFGQFLRIKLTDDAAEVWAIEAVAPAKQPREWLRWLDPRRTPGAPAPYPDDPVTARLIDHFVVHRKSSTYVDNPGRSPG